MRIFQILTVFFSIAIPAMACAAGPATRPTTVPAPADPGSIVVAEKKFDRNAISDAVEDLRDVTGAPIFVDWNHFDACGIGRDTEVSGEFKHKTVSAILTGLFHHAANGKPAPVVETVDGVITVAFPARIKRWKTLLAALPPVPLDGEPVPPAFRKLPLIAFEQTSISDVCQNLADLTGMKIEVDWDALAKAGITRQTPVTYKGANEPLIDVIISILFDIEPDKAKLSYTVTDNVISITAASEK